MLKMIVSSSHSLAPVTTIKVKQPDCLLPVEPLWHFCCQGFKPLSVPVQPCEQIRLLLVSACALYLGHLLQHLTHDEKAKV